MDTTVRLPVFGDIEDVRIVEYDEIEKMKCMYIGTDWENGISVYENKTGGIYYGCRTH